MFRLAVGYGTLDPRFVWLVLIMLAIVCIVVLSNLGLSGRDIGRGRWPEREGGRR